MIAAIRHRDAVAGPTSRIDRDAISYGLLNPLSGLFATGATSLNSKGGGHG
jgi:hypothetical protein